MPGPSTPTSRNWWSAYTLGIGPAGVYYRSLDATQREAVRAESQQLLGHRVGRFTVEAACWFAAGTAPSPGPLTELDARRGQGERGTRIGVASGSAAGPFSAPLLAWPSHQGIVVDRDAPSPAREADSAESAE